MSRTVHLAPMQLSVSQTVDAILAIVNSQQIFLQQIKEGKYVSKLPVSNPEPLFPNISLIPLHYRVDPPNCRKI